MFISLLSPIFGGFRKGITNNQKKKKEGETTLLDAPIAKVRLSIPLIRCRG